MKLSQKVLGILGTILFSLILAFSMVQSEVLAAQNTTSNGSVIIKEINNVDDLRDYVDNDGAYSSLDIIEDKFSDIHKIIVKENGTLVMCGLEEAGYIKTQLFSDSSLTNCLLDEFCMESTREKIPTVEVKKGTYYYRGKKWNGYNPSRYAMYVGFIPANRKAEKQANRFTDTTIDSESIDIKLVGSPQEFKEYCEENPDPAFTDTIESTERDAYGKIYEFTVEEAGWLFAKPKTKDIGIQWSLYTHRDFCSRLGIKYVSEKEKYQNQYYYLTPGTYYIRANRWNGHQPEPYGLILGFLPASNRIQVDDIKLSKDHSYATVTFDYDDEYFSDFLNDSIRIVSGKVHPCDLQNNDIWKTNDRSNAIDSNKVKFTKNGVYTARIESKKDDFYCLVTFKVSGIVPAPKTPSITSAKKNAKVIKGTADKNTTVYVSVGEKTIKTTSNSKGKWTIELKTKLARKTKITAYAVNPVGCKSKVQKYTVR